jgi:hypothetical protein
MQLELIVNAFWSCVGLLALIAFYFVIFVPMMGEAFREQLQSIAGMLDDYMSEGLVPERARAVVRLRAVIDGLSNSANETTLLRVLLSSVLLSKATRQAPTFKSLLAEIANPAARRKLWELHVSIQLELVQHVCKNSPLGWILVAITFPIYMFQVGKRMLREDRVWRRILFTVLPGPVSATEARAEFEGACATPA